MIRFGMALMEIIEQLTKGFIKATGRQPDNLEKLKIQQEAVQRFKDMNKVVDMEGNVIDTSKGIMGGKQIQDSPEFGKKIKETYDAAKGPGKGQEMVDALKSPGAQKTQAIMEDQLGMKLYGDETFEEILEIQKTGKHPRGEPKAQGGRAGFKDGMSRRKFMQIMGGLAAIPIVGKFFKVGKVAAPTVEKVIEKASTSDVPPYFLNLVNKIKNLGQKFDGPTERSESFLYKDYSMDIDLDTGKIDIKKTREAMIPGSDEAGIAEEVYMTYKPGMADETTKGKKVVDEYEEFTARPDIDGKMKDVDEGVPDEVIEEGTMFEDNMTEFGKASGGIARMLGE